MSVPSSALGWSALGLLAAVVGGVVAAQGAPKELPRKVQGLPASSIPAPISWSPPGEACWTLRETRLYATPGKRAWGAPVAAGRPVRCGAPGKWTPVAFPGSAVVGFIDGWDVGFEPPDPGVTLDQARSLLASDAGLGIGALFTLAAASPEGSPAWEELANALLSHWVSADAKDGPSAWSAATDCQPLGAEAAYTMYAAGGHPPGVGPHPDLFASNGDAWVAVHLAADQLVTGRVESGCTAVLYLREKAGLLETLRSYTDLSVAPIGVAALAWRATGARIVRVE